MLSSVPSLLTLFTVLAMVCSLYYYSPFRFPLHAIDRREYQVYVHILHSAALLTGRTPVLPLAQCSAIGGEWGENSRCVFVVHAKQPAGNAADPRHYSA